jgi:hypothetical protein
MTEHTAEKVALFIDVKNYIKPFNNDQNQIIDKLRWIQTKASEYGAVIQQQAYADFTHGDVPAWLPAALTALGVQCVLTPCYGGGLKDMDDQLMARDITVLPFSNPNVTAIFAVTGDGHIVPALSFYRSTGRKVLVISSNGTNAMLRDYANDGFYQLEPQATEDDDDTTLEAQIESLVSTHEYSKDGLVKAIRDASPEYSPQTINQELARLLKSGKLSHEQKCCHGYPTKILRWKRNTASAM